MTPEEFVDVIRLMVRDASISDTISVLSDPLGRKVSSMRRARSDWYKALPSAERRLLIGAIEEAVDSAVFGLFAVLDGVRAAENGPNKGRFELRHIGATVSLLTTPTGPMLHDLYNTDD